MLWPRVGLAFYVLAIYCLLVFVVQVGCLLSLCWFDLRLTYLMIGCELTLWGFVLILWYITCGDLLHCVLRVVLLVVTVLSLGLRFYL